jgi:hypothetical protein
MSSALLPKLALCGATAICVGAIWVVHKQQDEQRKVGPAHEVHFIWQDKDLKKNLKADLERVRRKEKELGIVREVNSQ